MKLVFLSLEAVSFFQIYGPPPEAWYESFAPSLIPLPSCVAENGDVLVLTFKEAANISQLSATLIVAKNDTLFSEITKNKRLETFNRVLRLSRSAVDRSINAPTFWRPWNAGSLITIQASPRASGENARVLFDKKIIGEVAGTCYGVVSSQIDLESENIELIDGNFANARLNELKNAIRIQGLLEADSSSFDLEASTRVLGLGDSLQSWFDTKLTTTQRHFVNHQLNKSIRVRGPAGSGKTIAMVVKLLRQFEIDSISKKNKRYALITHSEATIELIWAMIRTMVSGSELSRITNSGNLQLATLYSLAYDTLGTELRGVQPLSLDGRSGREMQKEMLDSLLIEYLKNQWLDRKSGCSPEFIKRIEEINENDDLKNIFLLEILNEFSCVLEPEGISRSAKKKEEYINKSPKEKWRLKLSSPDERRVILDLHGNFRLQLRDMEAISVDQLISDFDRFLDSNTWDITRQSTGFDAIFVDELHLLNRMERMIITSLVKDPGSHPVVVMAEDTKQDVKRASTGIISWQQQFDGLADFALNEVFRYTPQINAFLRAIDDFAPTLNLEEDWPSYGQVSNLPNGPFPSYKSYDDLKTQYSTVFLAAERAAKKRRNGRTVAVLTCDYTNFKKYLQAGEHRDLFTPIESRDDITSIPSRGTKFILSMPEFVAGLQFEEVFLIDVSDNSLNAGESVGVIDKRRGLTTVYLGASRSMFELTLCGLKDAGGIPRFVEYALQKCLAQASK